MLMHLIPIIHLLGFAFFKATFSISVSGKYMRFSLKMCETVTGIKFGLSEKHTKFEKIFLMVLTNQLIYLVNVKTIRKIFFELCVLLKKS